MPELDREGRAVCQFWLQHGKPQRDSHRQELAWREPPWGPPDPPLFRDKGGALRSPKNSLKKKHQQRESNLARRKRSQRYSSLPPVAPFCIGCQPEGIDL